MARRPARARQTENILLEEDLDVATTFVDSTLDRLLVERVSNGMELAALVDEWNALAGDVPFQRHEWLETWWRHYSQPACELFVLTVRSPDGDLVGLAPWYRARGFSGLRTLRQLGSGEVASDYVGILAAPNHWTAVSAELARWLAEDAVDDWDLIEIEAVTPDDLATQSLRAEMAPYGHTVERSALCQTWRVPLPNSWDAYLAGLSKLRRGRLRGLARRFLDSRLAVQHSVTGGEDLAQGLRILADLHQRRSESLGQPDCFASPRFARFHAEVARRFLDLGRLRLNWLEIDSQPAAVEYALSGGRTIYYYQSGFDPVSEASRPGWLSLIASLREAIDEGYETLDFLRGDESYKSSLGARPVPLEQIRIVGRRAFAKTSHRVWLAGSRAKRWARAAARLLRGAARPAARFDD
jgi:CelD/BcsL family acetyltransferase involved in cellulose biosynthesis